MEKITLEYWPIDRLRPYEHSLRRNDDFVERMADAIHAYGFRVPILARRDGEVIDGELRLKAARHLGMTTVPVLPADGLTEAQVRAFRLLVNRSATWAKWDNEAVAIELAALRDMDIDLADTGFDASEIDRFLRSLTTDEKDPDTLPDVPETPVSRDGDLWLLGDHRLLCGDATLTASYQRLMGAESAEMLWTDPPYNVGYEGKAGRIKNDAMADDAFVHFLTDSFLLVSAYIQRGGAIYIAHADAGVRGLAFRQALITAKFEIASCLIWRKNQAVLSRADYHWQHEPILYGWRPGAPHRWRGDRKQTSVLDAFPAAVQVAGEDGRAEWHVVAGERLLRITGTDVLVQELPTTILHAAKPQASELHPTMKPVALIERMIMNSSGRGDLVLDPFGGSGSTLMACERTERVCRMMELEPRFADVIVQRWQEATGQEARLDGGKTFNNLRVERLACPDGADSSALWSGAERGATGERQRV